MNFLLLPLIFATVFLFIERNKSPHYKSLFIATGAITLILVALMVILAFGLRDIQD